MREASGCTSRPCSLHSPLPCCLKENTPGKVGSYFPFSSSGHGLPSSGAPEPNQVAKGISTSSPEIKAELQGQGQAPLGPPSPGGECWQPAFLSAP